MGTATLAAEAGRQCARPICPATALSVSAAGVGPPHVLSHAGEIYTLYVSPEHHDRGVGRALLLSLFDALIDRGLNSAVVWVLRAKPGALYEAMGGRRVAEKKERLWNTVLPQAAYGWDDLRLVRAQRDIRET